MRFNPLASAALASALALTACATPGPTTRAEQTLRQVEKQFGTTKSSQMQPLYKAVSPDGAGFTMFRVYSEKPLPSRFGTDVPETFENALVLDVGVEMKLENGFPLYRVALKPRKIETQKVWDWPSHVLLKGVGADGKARKLAAKLPADREPDANGLIWTDWTYCADCVNLRGIETASVDALGEVFEHFDAAAAVAAAPNGTVVAYDDVVQFVAVPGIGILTGDQAHDMANVAVARVDLARKRARMAAPARRAYDDMVAAFAQSMSPSNAITRACGTYVPNQDRVAFADEKKRFDAYQTCAGRALATFPSADRQLDLASYASQEAMLAKKAGLSDGARTRAYTLSYEVEQAGEMIEDMRRLFNTAVADQVGMGTQADMRAQDRADKAVLADAQISAATTMVESPQPQLQTQPQPQPQPLPDSVTQSVMAEPPAVDYLYVARAIKDGASRQIGSTRSCIDRISCEVGRVIPLIAVETYCEDPAVEEKSVTATVPGWGVVIERYNPQTKSEEMLLRSVDRPEPLYSVARTDTGAFDAALKRLNTYNAGAGMDFFPTYQTFYVENTDGRKCKDAWRDGALHKVYDN